MSARTPRALQSPRRLLLDTHVWLWWQADDRRLGSHARHAITVASEVRFSAASMWEMAIKASTGKLKLPAHADVLTELERNGFAPLSIEVSHADGVRALPPLHRDPFDRLLVAQALAEGLTMVTVDPQFAGYGVALLDATQ